MERVARIFPDCTTTVVVCGYVNRSQSKYICTHKCNAARGARSADRDAIVPRASCSFDILFAPRYAQSAATSAVPQKIDALRFRDKHWLDRPRGLSFVSFPTVRSIDRSISRSSLCVCTYVPVWRTMECRKPGGGGKKERISSRRRLPFFATRMNRQDKIRGCESRIKVTKIRARLERLNRVAKRLSPFEIPVRKKRSSTRLEKKFSTKNPKKS